MDISTASGRQNQVYSYVLACPWKESRKDIFREGRKKEKTSFHKKTRSFHAVTFKLDRTY